MPDKNAVRELAKEGRKILDEPMFNIAGGLSGPQPSTTKTTLAKLDSRCSNGHTYRRGDTVFIKGGRIVCPRCGGALGPR